MKLQIFSAYDAKACTFGNPWYDQTDGAAIRNFADAVNDNSNPNNLWAKHPEDFSLFHLGEFDNNTCTFTLITPVSLVTGSALRKLSFNTNDIKNSSNGQQLEFDTKLPND